MPNNAIAVLLIEDDPSDALLVSGMLRPRPGQHFEAEFAVTQAEQLEQALALIARQSFQAILCDLSLPDSEGLSTFRRIRAAAPEAPLLILTGHDSDTVARNALHEGAQDYLDKNHLNSHSLPRAIRYAMERKRLELERDRAERERLLSEEYSREILSSLAAHIAVIDSDGTILTVNRAWERFARANGDPLFSHTGPGANYIDVCYRAAQAGNRTAAAVAAGLQAVLVGGRPHFQTEYDCHSPTEQRWFTIHAAPLFQDRTRLVIAHENITSRVLAELALRQSEERYRSLAEAAHDQIFIIDRNLNVEYVNTAAAQAFGLEPAGLIGRPLRDIFPPHAFERQAASLRRVMETGAPDYGESLTPFPGGERWLGTQLAPLQNEAGEVTGVLGIARDITDRRAAEEQLRYQAMIAENISDAIITLDSNSIIRSWNKAAERLHGYTAAEAIGRSSRELLAGTYHETTREEVRRVLAEQGHWEGEVTVTRRDGATAEILLTATVLRDAEGHITGMLAVNRDITERKRAEAALLASEEKYRSLVDYSLQSILIYQRGRIVFVNPAACEMLGRTAEELLALPSSNIMDIIHPHDRAGAIERLRVRESGRPIDPRTEYRIVRPDGSLRWIESFIHPITYEGQPALLSTSIDVTDRKRAEAAREQSERLFRSLIENSADAIAMLDADGNLLSFASTAANRMLGYSLGEVTGRNVLDFVHPEDRLAAGAMFDRLLEDPSATVTFEVRLRHHDGSWRWVEVVGSNMLADPAVAAIVANYRDITARKEAEALQRYQATLLAQATDAVVATDENGVVRIWNKTAETMLGYTAEEAVGQDGVTFFSAEYPGTDLNAVIRQIADTGSWKGEMRARRKDGSWLDTATSITAINDAAGRVTGYLTISHDITALKESERALIRQADELTVLHAAAEAGNRAASEDELFENVTRIIGATLYSDHFGILVLNADEQALIVHPSYQGRRWGGGLQRVPLGEGVTGWVAATGRPWRVADVRTEPRYRAASPETLSELCVPIQIESRIYGVINAESSQPNAFTESDERLLITLARQLATAVEKLRLLEALRLSEGKYRTIAEQLPVILYEVTLSDPPGWKNRTTYISPQVEGILGFTPKEWLAEDKIWTRLLHPDDRDRVLTEVFSGRDKERPLDIEYRSYTRDGRVVWFRNRNRFLPAAGGQPARLYGVMFDITGLKQAEEAVRESEAVFRRSIEAAGAVPYRRDHRANRYVYMGEGIQAITGYSAEEFTAELLESLIVENQPGGAARGLPIDEALRLAHAGQLPNWRNDLLIRTRDGGLRWVADSSVDVCDDTGAVAGSIGMLFDITDRKQAEEAVRRSEERFRLVARATNDAIWDWDLRTGAIWWNTVFYTLFGYSESDIRPDSESWKALIHPDDRDRIWDSINAAIETGQEYWQADYRFCRADGSYADVQDRGYIVSENGRPVRMLGSMADVTEQKQRARELEAIAILSTTLRTATTPSDMLPVLLNKTLELLRGDSAAIGLVSPGGDEMVKVLGRGELGSEPNRVFHRGEGIGGRVWATGQPYVTNDLQNDPQVINVAALPRLRSLACVPLIAHETTLGVLWVGRSQHYQQAASFAENELRLLAALADIAANALRRAALHDETRRRAEQLAAVNRIGRAISETLDVPGIHRQVHQIVAQLFPDTAALLIASYDDMSQQFVCDYGVVAGQVIDIAGLPPTALAPEGEGPESDVVRTRQVILLNDPNGLGLRSPLNHGLPAQYIKSALLAPMLARGVVRGVLHLRSQTVNCYSKADSEILALVANAAAIGLENARLFAETQHRLMRLQALRTIDEAVSASLDLRFTLNVLLLQAIEQLQVDAACVLLLSPHTQVLEYAAGQGFRTRAIERSAIRLGQGVAGQAAFTRRPTGVIAINDPRHNFSRRALLADEGFVSYYSIPIVAKGTLKGLLEVYNRSPLRADADWEDFVTTIAHQSAIAIENIALYEDLQRTNTELSLAYDTTLEGWSRALDLRDEETEGHSQRVTDLSVQLARALGLSEADIVHLRRGALLHDIGKMGVPDSILRKPGPLTPEELAVMRRHPQYAYDLLHPIPFLRPAIDIPYCHHEKWDGTGYPQGLKGLEIPLAARIFAAVDVWDALTSDRPYRRAWPADKARAYLIEQGGRHFDPKVVEAFLPLIP